MPQAIPSPESPPDRIAALDGVRGLAILLVVVMHSLYLAPAVGGDLAGPYAHFALLGWCGVDVFFVLSGFLITGILVRAKGAPNYFRNFYARRTLRIFPLYYLVVVLLLYGLPRPPAAAAEQLLYFLDHQNFHFALADGPFDPARLITWSLAIEEQFYLLWPALVWWLSKRRLVFACAVMIALAMALRFTLLASGFSGTHFLTPCRMDTLAVGALLAILPPPRAWFGGLATALGAVGLVAVALLAHDSRPEALAQQRWGLPCALALGVGLLTLARSERRLLPLFTLWPLRSLGKYSYCIYLTHFLVIETMTWQGYMRLPAASRQWLRDHLPPVAIVIAFTVVCLSASWLLAFVSWHLFEKWFLSLKRFFPSGGGPQVSERSRG